MLAPLAALLVAQYPGAMSPLSDFRKGYDAITVEDAKKHLGFLAGPDCEGRGTGTPGFQKAADYVAARFKEYGLKPIGDDGTYFQWNRDAFTRYIVKSAELKVGGKQVSIGPDLFPGRAPVSGTFRGPLIVVRAPEGQSDLPQDIDVKGAIVLMVGPGANASLRFDAEQRGSAATFTVRPTVPRNVWSVGTREPSAKDIAGQITERVAKRLVGPAPLDLTGLSKVEATRLANADLEMTGVVEKVSVPNVVGLIEGSDPTLKDEIVGIGGHLDHLGTNGIVTYPGADDDGSGSTAVLEIARAMSRNPVKPRRSILFMTFFGEEMGLLGSRYYASHPIFPMDKMVAELQMDMVARDSYGPQNGDQRRIDKLEENRDTMRLVGSKRISTQLDAIIQSVNRYVGFRFLYDGEDVYTRSDHYSFASRGVPIAFLFDGFTPDYHQPSDTLDKIDWLKLTNAAKLFYLTAYAVADRDQPLVKDVK